MTDEAAHPGPTAATAASPETGAGHEATGTAPSPMPAVPPPPPDDENPALIDGHKAFIITMVSIGMFVAFVVLFVL